MSVFDSTVTAQPRSGTVKGLTNLDGNAPGIVALANCESLSVQQVEYMKDLRRYHIFTSTGDRVFTAEEVSGGFMRRCCSPGNPMSMVVRDADGNEAFTISRGYACCCCEKMQVVVPPDKLIGRVKQQISLCHPKYVVRNDTREVLLKAVGPPCTCCFCGGKLNAHFKLISPDGHIEMGSIFKEFIPYGPDPRLFTADDRYYVTFTHGMDNNLKAIVLGSSLVVDYNFFYMKEAPDDFK